MKILLWVVLAGAVISVAIENQTDVLSASLMIISAALRGIISAVESIIFIGSLEIPNMHEARVWHVFAFLGAYWAVIGVGGVIYVITRRSGLFHHLGKLLDRIDRFVPPLERGSDAADHSRAKAVQDLYTRRFY